MVENEELIPLYRVKQYLPDRPTYMRLYRWWKRGVRQKYGPMEQRQRVFLEVYYYGATPCTSLEAIKRFLDKINDHSMLRRR